MPIANQSLWARGVIAGVVGATVLAAWFLLVDAAQGEPFQTPALLASSLFGVEGLEARPGLIFLYTILHYAAFIAVGVGVAWAFTTVAWGPSVLLGLVLGFILFDIAFYGSAWVTGIDVVAELGWIEVLVGNLLAGLSIMGYLHWASDVRPVTWWDALADHRIVREGLIAGAVGGLVVAGWFFFFDLTQGRPLFTPAALGSAIFLGASDLAAVEINLWTVAAYTVIHLLAFMVVGLIASAIARETETAPPMMLGALLLFVAFGAFFLGILAVIAEFLLGPIAWWAIAVGNGLAVLGMGYYLWKRHPRLQEALASDPFDRTA